jgi:hypothetical protein
MKIEPDTSPASSALRFWTCRSLLVALAISGIAALSGCATSQHERTSSVEHETARAEIAGLLPSNVSDRAGWTVDILAAFEALDITPTAKNICAVVAVAQQESTFQVNPSVPGLPAIAWREIDARAARYHLPKFAVHAAFQLQSPNGKRYSERIDKATTEKALSDIFEDFIGMVPLGKTLFADWNPVRTAGPMQVSIAFAEKHAAAKQYPYPLSGNIRHEIFTRRGGMYFGIAHLLDYPVTYDDMVFRFADYNAGLYASRNAAFQNAVSIVSKTALALDGDLVRYGSDAREPSNTELAIRKVASRIELSDANIHADLELGEQQAFERTRLYQRVFALAEKGRGSLPRAMMPRIRLQSPKITRTLTTDWFAHHVDERYKRCLSHGEALLDRDRENLQRW